MTKKPKIICQIDSQQWSFWAFSLILLLVFFNANACLMANMRPAVNTVLNVSNASNVSLPRDAFNAVSFEKASQPVVSAGSCWTSLEETGACLCGLIAICSFVKYRYYPEADLVDYYHTLKQTIARRIGEFTTGARSADEPRGKMIRVKEDSLQQNDKDVLHQESCETPSSSGIGEYIDKKNEQNSRKLEKEAAVAPLTKILAARSITPEEEQKLMDGFIPLIETRPEIANFLEGATLSDKEKQQLQIYLLLAGKSFSHKRFNDLSAEEQKQFLSNAESHFKNLLKDLEKTCLDLADEQCLNEILKEFLNMDETSSDDVMLVDSSFEGEVTAQSEATLYKNNLLEISNLSIPTEKKLNLLSMLIHPFSSPKMRLEITNFPQATHSQQSDIFQKIERIKIRSLLEKFSTEDQTKLLLNICVNSSLTYCQKLDLIVAAGDQKVAQEDRLSIIEGEQLDTLVEKFQHASDCDERFFNGFFKNTDQSIAFSGDAGAARGAAALKKLVVENTKGLSCLDRWSLALHYLSAQTDRAGILNYALYNSQLPTQLLAEAKKITPNVLIKSFFMRNAIKDVAAIVAPGPDNRSLFNSLWNSASNLRSNIGSPTSIASLASRSLTLAAGSSFMQSYLLTRHIFNEYSHCLDDKMDSRSVDGSVLDGSILDGSILDGSILDGSIPLFISSASSTNAYSHHSVGYAYSRSNIDCER